MKSIIKELFDGKKVTAIYAGGFKPPTKGHFLIVQKALKSYPEIDKFIILVGSGTRDGITQEQSLKIWDYYKEVLGDKIEIKPSSSPIGDIMRYADSNPDEIVYYISGVRNEEDIKDLEKRTKTISKYPNLKLKLITTSLTNVSGTNARKALQTEEKEFFEFLPTEVPNSEKKEIYNLLKDSSKLQENLNNPNLSLKDVIKELVFYIKSKGINIEPLPRVRIINNDTENSSKILGKTAYYDPNDKVIVLYTHQRHPKDIARSFTHELIHHKQNLEGKLNAINSTNTNDEGDLPEIEREAYEKGNMLFRNWEDMFKTKYNLNENLNSFTKLLINDFFG